MKRKYFRRILALLIAMTMASGSAVTVFASEPGTESESSTDETQAPESEENTITTVEEPVSDMKLTEVSVIPDGVTIGDIEVGGMTGAEAYALVEDYLNEKAQSVVDLSIDEEVTEVTLEELGLYWKNEGEVAELLDTVSRGNLLAQYKTVKDIENDEADTAIQYAVDQEAALAVLDDILVPLNVEPQNATCTRNADGTWNITEEIDGIVANSEETLSLISAELEGWDEQGFEIEVPAEITRADITSEVYAGMSTSPIASFSTDYWTATESRNNNVALAASKVNGRMIMPDEVMSMLDMVSPVTAAAGYGYAGAYSNGSVIQSIGGGICQMATTFYNTALQLELEIVERRSHSMAVNYVPLAMDATISPGGQDLKIKNTTGHALYIESYVSGHDLFVNFYGVDNRPTDRKVVYRSVTISQEAAPPDDDQEDMSLPIGKVVYSQDPHQPAVADLYKDIYNSAGELVESVYMYRSTYKGCRGIRRYGPAIDDAGTHYYIDNQGYAVGEDGTRYRLNPDGTFLDLPPANQTTEAPTEEETPESTEAPETPTEAPTEASAAAADESAD